MPLLRGALLLAWWTAMSAAADVVPPHALESFERGLAAVEQSHWPIAIREFEDAQKSAPSASPILFNLGLARARLGHELPAVAWFRAYLAAAPRAENADAVRKEIVRLEVALQAKVAKLIQEALAAAEKLGDRLSTRRSVAVDTVRGYQAQTGDVEGALKAGYRGSYNSKTSPADDAWGAYALHIGVAWSVEKAEEALRHVSDAASRDHVNAEIAERLAKGTLFASLGISGAPVEVSFRPAVPNAKDLARAAARRIADPRLRVRTLVKVLGEDVRPNDLATLESLIDEASSTGVDFDTEKLVIAALRAKIDASDIEGATRLAARLLKFSAAKQSFAWSGAVKAIQAVPAALLVRGDVAGARAVSRKLLDGTIEPHRANLEAVLGNYQATRALAAKLECAHDKKVALFEWTIFVQVATGDLAGARKSIKEAAAACAGHSTWGRESIYGMAMLDALLTMGDLGGAIAFSREMGLQQPRVDGLKAFARRAQHADLIALERAAKDSWKFDSPTVELMVADAYETRGVAMEAQGLRVRAAKYFLANPDWAKYESSDTVANLVQALETSGEAAAAKRLAESASRFHVPPAVAAWAELARGLAAQDHVVDLPRAVRAAAQDPRNAYQKLSDLALETAQGLFALRGAAQRMASK